MKEVIEARGFRLRDSQGRIRAEVALDDDEEPALRLYDRQGTVRTSVKLHASSHDKRFEHPLIQISNEEGKPRFQLSGNCLWLWDNKGEHVRVELGYGLEPHELKQDHPPGSGYPVLRTCPTAHLTLSDENGTPRAVLQTTGKSVDGVEERTLGAQIAMYGRDSKERVRLTGYDTFAQFTLDTQDSEMGTVQAHVGAVPIVWNAPVAELTVEAQGVKAQIAACDGAPHMALYDSGRRARLHLTLNGKGRPRILKYVWRWLVPLWSHVSPWPTQQE